MTVDGGALYRDLVLAEVPRILGLGDREPASATCGCFDRSYWQYRVVDFANARFQEVALLLALLHRHDFPGNAYFGKAAVREWARAAVVFWASRRNADGSVAEVYPSERSFCATAFTFAAVTEVHLLLGGDAPAGWRRTADWLAGADNRAVANQMAAAAVALVNWSLLAGEPRYADRAREKVAALRAGQDRDGAFPEYGGADLGYHTVTLGQLVRYQHKAKDDDLGAALARATAFVEQRVGPDGRYEAAAGSRRTQFIYPYGLVVLGSDVVPRHLRGLREGRVLHPGWLDDRYVIQLSIDFLEAGLEPPPRG
jgi:hypothetical protein